MKVLLLEPDRWRFLGISQVLRSDPRVLLLGERDHQKVLNDGAAARSDLAPHVVILSHSLIRDHGRTAMAKLQALFPQAHILVDGYDTGVDTVADVLRGGAKGYFVLSSEPAKLLQALTVVQKGFIWAPREALPRMMAKSSTEPSDRAIEQLSRTDREILKLLHTGLSNKDIARTIGVAEVTVKTRLTKLYRRFSVHSRLGLLAFALDHHLLKEPADLRTAATVSAKAVAAEIASPIEKESGQ